MTEQEKATRRAEKDDLIAIMALPEGRRFLCRIIVRSQHFVGGMSVGEGMAYFREGSRDIGLWLTEELFRINPARAGEILGLAGKEEDDE